MAGSVRTLHVAGQAVVNVAPSAWSNLRFVKFKHTPKYGRLPVEEENGTRIEDTDMLQGIEYSEFDIEVYVYFDSLGIWLRSLLGTPVTTLVTDQTAVWKHVFKGGASDLPMVAVRWYNGRTWKRSLNCRVNTTDFTMVTDKIAKFSLKLLGKKAVTISAPTPASISIPAYKQPAHPPRQSVTLGGSAFAKLKMAKITLNNNLTPDHDIQEDVDLQGVEEGKFKALFDVTAEFVAASGSLDEKYENNTPMGELALYVKDNVTNIGVSPFAHPQIKMVIPDPRIEQGGLDQDKKNVQQQAKGRGMYYPADATNFYVELTNEVENYNGS